MMGRSLKEAMSLMICSVKAPGMAATPNTEGHQYQIHLRVALRNSSSDVIYINIKINFQLKGQNQYLWGLIAETFQEAKWGLGAFL